MPKEITKKDNVLKAIIESCADGLCMKSRQELAYDLGYSKRTVGYWIDSLAEEGYLVKQGAAVLLNRGVDFTMDYHDLEEAAEEVVEARASVVDVLNVDPKIWFLVLMMAQTVHTFKFIYFISGADAWSMAYAGFTCIGMDFVTYTFVVKGEKYKVDSMKAFYILANVYAFNVGLFGDLVLGSTLFWEVVPNGRFWISLIPSFFIPHMAVKFSEWVYVVNRK